MFQPGQPALDPEQDLAGCLTSLQGATVVCLHDPVALLGLVPVLRTWLAGRTDGVLVVARQQLDLSEPLHRAAASTVLELAESDGSGR